MRQNIDGKYVLICESGVKHHKPKHKLAML